MPILSLNRLQLPLELITPLPRLDKMFQSIKDRPLGCLQASGNLIACDNGSNALRSTCSTRVSTREEGEKDGGWMEEGGRTSEKQVAFFEGHDARDVGDQVGDAVEH